MTREEIRERAVQIGDDVEITSTHEEWNATVEMHIAKIVRATLQEAARAVCSQCAKGGKPITDEATPEWWHAGDSYSCRASEIHDLIAAMDGEASHE